jgi:hypothetical protein
LTPTTTCKQKEVCVVVAVAVVDDVEAAVLVEPVVVVVVAVLVAAVLVAAVLVAAELDALDAVVPLELTHPDCSVYYRTKVILKANL